MTSQTQETLGTWTNGTKKITARYYDEGMVMITTQDGSDVVSEEAWLRRLEIIKAAGAVKA